jgi:hypothetical protein
MSKNPDQGWKIEQIEKGIHDRRNHTRRAVPLERRDVALLEGPPRCASGPASTPCGIGGNPDVQAFVRHIWSVELRWAQRLADLPETPKEAVHTGPSIRFSICTCRRPRSTKVCWQIRPRTGKLLTRSPLHQSRPRSELCPAAKSWGTRSSTANAIGHSSPRSSAPPASLPASVAICSLALRYVRIGPARRRLVLRETDAAKHRPALRRFEWNRRLFAAYRTRRARLRPHSPPAARAALRLALLAALGVIHKLFVVEKNLLAGGEHKLRPAIDAY